MSTYWPNESAVRPTLVECCRFCGDSKESFHPAARGCEANGFGDHEYVEINADRLGPVGAGTAGARMHWLWERLHEFEPWLIEHGDYNPVSSRHDGMIEVCLIRALTKLVGTSRKEGGT